jgi:hypothetical protein
MKYRHSTYTWQTHSSTGPAAYIIHHAFNLLPASNSMGYFLFLYSDITGVQSVTNTYILCVTKSRLSTTLDNDLITSFRNVLNQFFKQSTTIMLCAVRYLNLAPPDEAL